MGNTFTEADVRLFTTLVRFDPVYVGKYLPLSYPYPPLVPSSPPSFITLLTFKHRTFQSKQEATPRIPSPLQLPTRHLSTWWHFKHSQFLSHQISLLWISQANQPYWRGPQGSCGWSEHSSWTWENVDEIKGKHSWSQAYGFFTWLPENLCRGG